MKNLKTLCILFLSLSIISCSSSDDDGGGTAPAAEYTATISGATFGDKYTSTLGSYFTDTSAGITIAITDANHHVIRIFLNDKDGFDKGVTKVIGEQDYMGYYSSIVVRDQTEEVSYNSAEGSISILENKPNPASEDGRLISGTFSMAAPTSSGLIVTMTGSFKNMAY